MAHVGLSFASFGEENSRSRLPGAEDLESRARKRPASANVRALYFLCKVILQKKTWPQWFKTETRWTLNGI
jgi:hypothetical protein